MESEMDADRREMNIDVVSDVVCPWCFVGKRRLAAALAQSGEPEAAVRWRAFQLDPTIPPQGMDRRAYMRAKFRDDARLAEVHGRLRAIGAEVGIDFDFDAISRSPNTLDAHRLIRWAAASGKQDEAVERLFSAYFEHGRDIGDRSVLIEIARDCGMDAEAVERRLGGDDDVAAVRAEIAEAQALGVTGVPFFIFASRFAVSGAQSAEVLAKAMERARSGGERVEMA
jgi:predicted DsbA family dithiol-disulfide isomerase